MAYFRCTGNSGGSLKLRTAQGEIASFETNLPEPYQSVTVNVVATGGNGTPDNPNPINGYSEANITRCGVNLWDEDMELGSLSWNTGLPYVDNTRMRFADYVKVEEGSSIYIVCPAAYDIHVFDINKEHITAVYKSAGGAYTIPSGGAYIKLTTQSAYGTTYNHDISINYPSTDTTYHAYDGNTYTVAFGQTVYGGVLDVTRGKLTVTHGFYTFTGNETEYIQQTNRVAVGTNIQSKSGSATCSHFANVLTGSTRFVYIPTNMTANDLRTFMQGNTVTLCYELATPFDIDLTPVQISAIVGENNVYSDTNGDTTVQYLDLRSS